MKCAFLKYDSIKTKCIPQLVVFHNQINQNDDCIIEYTFTFQC